MANVVQEIWRDRAFRAREEGTSGAFDGGG